MRAMTQTPSPDGVRRRRVIVARATYPQLKTTVVPTLKNWLPKASGFEVTGQSPIVGSLEVDLGDGTRVELEFMLVAFDDAQKTEQMFASFEYSDLWLNEANTLSYDVLKYGQLRLGRYPPKIPDPDNPDQLLFDGCDKPTIILDSNGYADDSWVFDFFDTVHRDNPNIVMFHQPPALMRAEANEEGARYVEALDIWLKENPEAENIRFLPGGFEYYWNVVETSPDRILADILVEVTVSRHGKPVYTAEQYRDAEHYSSNRIDPQVGHQLLIGYDPGVRYSGWVFAQYIDAQLRVLDEFLIEDKAMAAQMEEFVVPLLNTRYLNIQDRVILMDPAGRARDSVEGVPLYVHLQNKYNIPVQLINDNKPSSRIAAVVTLLRRHKGLVLSNTCGGLRKGFLGGYHYAPKRVAGPNKVYREEPDKNQYSHIHDAVQYIAMHLTSTPELPASNNTVYDDRSPIVTV